MKLTDKNTIRKFLDLVNSGAPGKSYRSVGIGIRDISYHVGLIAEYEKVLAEPEPVKESVKKVEEPKKSSSTKVGSTLKSFMEEVEEEEEENEEG